MQLMGRILKPDEQQIEIWEENIYGYLQDNKEDEGPIYGDLVKTEEIMVDAFVQVSLENTEYVVSSIPKLTLSTDTQVQVDALGTDSQKD